MYCTARSSWHTFDSHGGFWLKASLHLADMLRATRESLGHLEHVEWWHGSVVASPSAHWAVQTWFLLSYSLRRGFKNSCCCAPNSSCSKQKASKSCEKSCCENESPPQRSAEEAHWHALTLSTNMHQSSQVSKRRRNLSSQTRSLQGLTSFLLCVSVEPFAQSVLIDASCFQQTAKLGSHHCSPFFSAQPSLRLWC